MVVTEDHGVRRDGAKLMHTFSDAGRKIRQTETGAVYDEAIDVITGYGEDGAPHGAYTYEETDIPIETEEEEE